VTAEMPCDCKHPKVQHAGATYACRDCPCKRYTPDIQQAALDSSLKCPCGPFRPGDPSDAHSVVHIAWLHRLEYRVPDGESTSARLRRVEQERDGLVQVVEQLSDDVLKLAAALKLAQAELASARAELEQLRGDLGVKRVGELEEQLALADPQGAVISRQRRYLCETCGSRYGIDYTDQAHGPLTPVVVTITRQGATP
jgi:hypothetical protein